MIRLVQVRALPGYKLWVRFDDATEGEVDLSHLVGKGVFAAWNDYRVFEQVRIESGAISWADQIDICPDTVYMSITGKTPEELFPSLRGEIAYA